MSSSRAARGSVARVQQARCTRHIASKPHNADGTRLAIHAGMTLPQLHPFSWTARFAPRSGDAGRRVLNVVIATLALVLALPLMAAIAVLIKLTSRGPVLFTQQRIGLDRRAIGNAVGNSRRHADHRGPTFTMYKFRKIHVNGGATQEVSAQRDGQPVTRVAGV